MVQTRNDAATPRGGRPRTSTAELGEALRESLIDAFGTTWNAYRQLSSIAAMTPVSFPTFSRAMRGLPIAPETLAAITASWDVRRVLPVAA